MHILAKNAIIEYLISGASIGSGGKTVVFLPGWGRIKEDFGSLARLLKARLADASFVQIDLPGFGGSAMPTDAGLGITDYVDILYDFFQKLGVERVVLIGHSFGAKIAIAYASRHPERVEKLVLIAAAGLSRKSVRARIARFLASVGRIIGSGFQDAAGLRRVRHLAQKFFAGSDYRISPAPLRETLKKNFAYDIRPDAGRVAAPTLLVWGKDDVITPLRDGRLYHSLIRNSRLEILPDCGHFPFLKHPEKCAELIASFLVD